MRMWMALVLFAGFALGQQKMLIEPQPGAGPKSAAEKQAIDKLVDLLSEQIQDQIPCSQPATMDEVRDMMSEARDKELIGTATGNELAQVLDKVGVQDVVTVNVTQMGGQMVVTVLWMDMKTARAKARDTAPVSGDDASLDNFAQKFASQMKAQSGAERKGACEPDKEWYGTVRATLTKDEQKTETKDRCTVKLAVSEVWKCTVRIPRKGKESAFATLLRKGARDSRCMGKAACGGQSKDIARIALQTEELIGASNVKAIALFETVDGKLAGSVALDTMPAQLTLTGNNIWEEGPCEKGKKESSNPPPQTIVVTAPGFNLPEQPLKPGQRVSRGSYTAKGVTIDWRLTRTEK